MSYDIYLPSENIFIEINGKQHYKFSKFFHVTQKGFDDSIERDDIKKKYAKENGRYLEINILEIENFRDAINTIEKFIEEKYN